MLSSFARSHISDFHGQGIPAFEITKLSTSLKAWEIWFHTRYYLKKKKEKRKRKNSMEAAVSGAIRRFHRSNYKKVQRDLLLRPRLNRHNLLLDPVFFYQKYQYST